MSSKQRAWRAAFGRAMKKYAGTSMSKQQKVAMAKKMYRGSGYIGGLTRRTYKLGLRRGGGWIGGCNGGGWIGGGYARSRRRY